MVGRIKAVLKNMRTDAPESLCLKECESPQELISKTRYRTTQGQTKESEHERTNRCSAAVSSSERYSSQLEKGKEKAPSYESCRKGSSASSG